MRILGTREPSTPDGSLPSCWELALRGCLGRQYPCVKGSVSVSPAAAVGLVNEEGEMVLLLSRCSGPNASAAPAGFLSTMGLERAGRPVSSCPLRHRHAAGWPSARLL
jgi:hypothetical protein